MTVFRLGTCAPAFAALVLHRHGGSQEAFVDFVAGERRRWEKIIYTIR
jgi:hypothetical protein